MADPINQPIHVDTLYDYRLMLADGRPVLGVIGGGHAQPFTAEEKRQIAAHVVARWNAVSRPPVVGRVLINGQTYLRPVVKVAVITLDGSSCIVPVGALLDVIEEGGPYTVQIKTMRQGEFERLAEFGGW